MTFDPHVRFAVGPARLPSISLLVAALLACNPKGDRTGNPVSTGSTASVRSSTVPSGSLGTVRGTITVKGDAPPTLEGIAAKIPVGKCFLAHEMYTKLYREGPGRTLADVLVAVTQFQGNSSEPDPVAKVEARDCAFATRTVALSLGQTLSVHNVGTETHTPQLVGLASPALLLAIPGGDPVEFVPKKLGQYQLVDRTHAHAFADVFVMNFSTTDVTGIDGKFEIAGVPPGKAKLSALLPITGQTRERDVDVPAGGSVEINFEFEFDAARDGEKAKAPASP